MGGGAVIRNAAKVAGLGVIGSYRGVPSSIPLAERVVTARNSAIPVPAVVVSPSATNEVRNSTVSISSLNGTFHSASVQMPSWEINEWEFIGEEGQDGRIFELMGRTPRVVFGAVPSFEEAKEATCDLKDALEKIYFSPNTATGGDGSSANVQSSILPRHMGACVTSDSAVTLPSDPKHAFQAFSLLQNSPDVQNVVTSLASDKNVWEAVMKNEEVMEFYKRIGSEGSPKNGSDDGKLIGSSINESTSLMQTIKLRVLAMVSNLSEFLQHIFRNPVEESSSENTIWKGPSIAASIMALTITAIMVIMVKRA